MSAILRDPRVDIVEVLYRYNFAIDHGDWDVYETVFAEGAMLDYRDSGWDVHTPQENKDILLARAPQKLTAQHRLVNPIVTVDGDTATVRSEFHVNTVWRTDTADRAEVITSGGWYDDRLQQTADGWRLLHRRSVLRWTEKHTIAWSAGGAPVESRFARMAP